jgi:hypothetical protein
MIPALQTVFQIAPSSWDGIDTGDCRLIVDAGTRHLQFAVLDHADDRIRAVGSYAAKSAHFTDWMDELSAVPLLKKKFGRTHVFYNLSDSVLVPSNLYRASANSTLLNLVHGDLRNGRQMDDRTLSLDIHHVYRLPEYFQDKLDELFPGAVGSHLYTCLLDQLAGPDRASGEHLHLFFYAHMILVLVIHKGRLQLLQSYPYDLPEDVSYQLLNICDQVGIEPEQVRVTIAGAVDPASPLYAEVLKYFLQVELAEDTNGIDFGGEFDDYPVHYFQPFTLLATCVS